jgi:Mn-dependent DtxR family transcriptional regulator
VQSNKFELTQEFLAQMLGVSRTSVTPVEKYFQSVGLIKYRRGHIELLDIEALQDAACECYRRHK